MLNALTVGVRGGKWHALIDKVESELNLFTSARKVVGKKGAAGVDRQSTEDFGEHEIDEIRRLHRQLHAGDLPPAAGTPSLDSQTGQPTKRDLWEFRRFEIGSCKRRLST